MQEQPSYYAIIPASVRYDKRLYKHGDEKVLFAEITALANKNGYCYATNGYFAELYGVSKVTVSRWINHLKKLGYLKVDMVMNGKKEIIQRKLYPIIDPINTDVNTPLNIDDKTPINTDVKENITSINNTRCNTSLSISPHGELTRKGERKPKTTKSKLEKSLDKWSEQIDSDVAQYGYGMAKENAASKSSELSYFNAIMRDWQDRGLSSLSEVKKYLKSKRNGNDNHSLNRRPDVVIPDWMNEKYDPEKDKLSPKKKAEMDRIMEKLKEGSSA